MKRLLATIELKTDAAVKSANRNFDTECLNENTLKLSFKWTNKSTTEESFVKYVKSYMRNFEAFKRAYEIKRVELIEEA